MLLKAEQIISVIQKHNILKKSRAQIDTINARMLRDLAERIKYVNDIGLLKAKYDIPEKQADRIEEIIQQAIEQNEKEHLDLTEEIIRDFFNCVIDVSMNIEHHIKKIDGTDDEN